MRPESLDQSFHLMNIIVPLYNHMQELQASCSVQFSSVAQLCPTHCDPMDHGTPGLPIHHQLPLVLPMVLCWVGVHWVGDAIQPSHPLSSPSPPTFNLSQHQGICKWVSSSHQVAKYWSFSFSISPPNAYSGLISFRMDCLDLLAVQTLSSWLPPIPIALWWVPRPPLWDLPSSLLTCQQAQSWPGFCPIVLRAKWANTKHLIVYFTHFPFPTSLQCSSLLECHSGDEFGLAAAKECKEVQRKTATLGCVSSVLSPD